MVDPGTDPLSPLAHDLIKRADYAALVAPSRTPSLAGELLSNVAPEALFIVPVTNRAAAWGALAGVWLWHDALSESHEIVQQSARDLQRRTPSAGSGVSLPQGAASEPSAQRISEFDATLSLWHAIVHRREGDFSNSKYWLARCRHHPILRSIGSYANDILHPLPADKSLLRLTRDGWDANAFVDLVESVHDRSGDRLYGAAVALQKIEWRLLFDFCTREAVG